VALPHMVLCMPCMLHACTGTFDRATLLVQDGLSDVSSAHATNPKLLDKRMVSFQFEMRIRHRSF
jgi:hypothetical protein